jgi:hypothetical protein
VVLNPAGIALTPEMDMPQETQAGFSMYSEFAITPETLPRNLGTDGANVCSEQLVVRHYSQKDYRSGRGQTTWQVDFVAGVVFDCTCGVDPDHIADIQTRRRLCSALQPEEAGDVVTFVLCFAHYWKSGDDHAQPQDETRRSPISASRGCSSVRSHRRSSLAPTPNEGNK